MSWEYRESLLQTFEGLFEQDGIAKERREAARNAFEKVRQAGEEEFEQAVREFLAACSRESAWIVDIPAIFEDGLELGVTFAEIKPYYGVTYFLYLGQGKFGNSPEQVQTLLYWLRRLLALNERLALSLLRGYHYIAGELTPDEIDRYIAEGISCADINETLAQQFLEGTLHDRVAIIDNLKQECRLTDIAPHLEHTIFALTGEQVAIASLDELSTYALQARRTRMVCLYRQVFLPAKMTTFDSKEENTNWFRLQTVIAAGMMLYKSFPRIHGHPDYTSAAALTGDSIFLQNLFQLVEYIRVLRAIQHRWPGSKTLIEFGIHTEYQRKQAEMSGAEQLFFRGLSEIFLNLLDRHYNGLKNGTDCSRQPIPYPFHSLIRCSDAGRTKTPSLQTLLKLAENSHNLFETAKMIRAVPQDLFLQEFPDFGTTPLRTFGFLPDFFYTGEIRSSLLLDAPGLENYLYRNFASLPDYLHPSREKLTPPEEMIQDLQEEEDHAEQEFPQDTGNDEHHPYRHGRHTEAGYAVYDEWNQEQNRYLTAYCTVHEQEVTFTREQPVPPEVTAEGHTIRRVFELLKPDNARTEKRLSEGDDINEPLLLDYIIATKREPSPPVRFFERSAPRKRDIAVLLLMDVSGSTGERVNQQRVIEIEQHAALVFSQGLAAIGDLFAICGFSSNGREHCEFLVFKDFDDPWDDSSRSRVLSARPMSTTRMGAALRHAGYRLNQTAARQKLILLITDGKPLDKDYSPDTRYAQHDVRMACLENKARGIVTFCLSTLENSRSDLELMFPDRRFIILENIQQLSRLLPRSYMKLTL